LGALFGDDGGDRGEITRLQAFSVDGIACCTSLSALAPSLPGFSALAVGALVKKRERVDCCLLVSAFAFDIVRLVMLAFAPWLRSRLLPCRLRLVVQSQYTTHPSGPLADRGRLV
jgi:hypothetical protein